MAAIRLPIISEFNGKGVSSAIKQFKQLETTGQKAQFVLQKAALPAAAALGGLAVAGVKFANAAAQDQKAQALLARQLRASTGATDAQVKSAEAYIEAAMMSAAVSDDELRPALSKLVTATKDVTKAQDLLNTALDVSAATGADLQTVSDALAKAYAGNMRGLRSLSPEMAKLIKQGASFSEVMAVLTQNFGGAAREAAGTTAGKLELMRIKFEELQENLGTALLPLMDSLANVLGKVADFANKHPKIFTAIATAVASAAAAILSFNAVMKVAAIQAAITGKEVAAVTAKYRALVAAAAPWVALGAGIAAVGYGIYKSFTSSGKAVDDLVVKAKAAVVEVIKLRKEAEAAAQWNQVIGNIGAVYGALGGYTKEATKQVKGVSGAMDKAADAAKRLRDAIRTQLQNVVDDSRTKLAEARQAFDDYATGLSEQIMGNISFGGIADAGAEAGKSFLDGLREATGRAQTFAELLNRLTAGGASRAVLEGVAGAGVEAGTKIAQELLSTVGGIQTANSLTAAAQSAADAFGKNAATKWASAGVLAATTYVEAVANVLAKYLPQLTSKTLTPKQLKRIQANLQADLANIQMAPAEGGAVSNAAQMATGNTNVTIQVSGGDPNAVVDALRRYMQINGSVPIRVSG